VARPGLTPRRGGPTVTGYLHWDHRRLDALLESSRSSLGDGAHADAAARFLEFATGLGRHIRMEEEVLFPAFEASTGMRGAGPTTVMRGEHLEILGILGEMKACVTVTDPECGPLLRPARGSPGRPWHAQ
jgi:hypothetical protein